MEKCSCNSNKCVLCYYNHSVQHLLFSMEYKIPGIRSKQRNAAVAHGEGLKFALLHQTWLVLAPVATLSVQQPSELHMAERAVKHLPWTHESALIHPGTTC